VSPLRVVWIQEGRIESDRDALGLALKAADAALAKDIVQRNPKVPGIIHAINYVHCSMVATLSTCKM